MLDTFDQWIESARRRELSDADIAYLAEKLAASGQILPPYIHSADLASTGGPGSLSTIWGPPALVALNYVVPKLGVPGRPAGGVDALAQIPGYIVNADLSRAREILAQCSYVHLLAAQTFAPLDAELFRHRQRVGGQGLPELAIASLLSKKLAMGVRTVGLEVRVASHGNFGGNLTKARDNASQFCRVAQQLGLTAACIIVDGSLPQQPYLGRGEAMLASFLIMTGKGSSWLNQHADDCLSWAAEIGEKPLPEKSDVVRAFRNNIVAQGGSIEALEEIASRLTVEHRFMLKASRDGLVSYDLAGLRDAIIQTRGVDSANYFIDTAGIILMAEPGAAVRAGDPIISARCYDESWASFRSMLEGAIHIAEFGVSSASRVSRDLEVVRV